MNYNIRQVANTHSIRYGVLTVFGMEKNTYCCNNPFFFYIGGERDRDVQMFPVIGSLESPTGQPAATLALNTSHRPVVADLDRAMQQAAQQQVLLGYPGGHGQDQCLVSPVPLPPSQDQPLPDLRPSVAVDVYPSMDPGSRKPVAFFFGNSNLKQIADYFSPMAATRGFITVAHPEAPTTFSSGFFRFLRQHLDRWSIGPEDYLILEFIGNSLMIDQALPGWPVRAEDNIFHYSTLDYISEEDVADAMDVAANSLMSISNNFNVVLLPPVPRYLTKGCCDHPRHMVGKLQPQDHLDKLMHLGETFVTRLASTLRPHFRTASALTYVDVVGMPLSDDDMLRIMKGQLANDDIHLTHQGLTSHAMALLLHLVGNQKCDPSRAAPVSPPPVASASAVTSGQLQYPQLTPVQLAPQSSAPVVPQASALVTPPATPQQQRLLGVKFRPFKQKDRLFTRTFFNPPRRVSDAMLDRADRTGGQVTTYSGRGRGRGFARRTLGYQAGTYLPPSTK